MDFPDAGVNKKEIFHPSVAKIKPSPALPMEKVTEITDVLPFPHAHAAVWKRLSVSC
jgi:hypothetical protein